MRRQSFMIYMEVHCMMVMKSDLNEVLFVHFHQGWKKVVHYDRDEQEATTDPSKNSKRVKDHWIESDVKHKKDSESSPDESQCTEISRFTALFLFFLYTTLSYLIHDIWSLKWIRIQCIFFLLAFLGILWIVWIKSDLNP